LLEIKFLAGMRCAFRGMDFSRELLVSPTGVFGGAMCGSFEIAVLQVNTEVKSKGLVINNQK
jgi:hypothetical protein